MKLNPKFVETSLLIAAILISMKVIYTLLDSSKFLKDHPECRDVQCVRVIQ